VPVVPSTLHPAVSSFLAEGAGSPVHRPRARAAFWTLSDGSLAMAATAGWLRLMSTAGTGYCVHGADPLDSEAIAQVDAALRTGARTTVVHRVAASTPTWFEASTWPLADAQGNTVATAAAIAECSEPVRRMQTAAGGAASNAGRSTLATPGSPRVASYR
jgi:hypothetical protein